MSGFNKLRIVLIVLVAILLCFDGVVGQNNSNTQGQSGSDDDPLTTEQTALEKGMAPVFKMCHNFLKTVMSANFYEATDSAFDAKDLTDIVSNDDYSKLQEDWQSLTKTFGGYAACMIIGMIFMVFMPIVGFIYCCCHCCCNKCGGTKEERDPKHAVCKRWTLTIILLICTTFMLAGCIILFLGSSLFHQALTDDKAGTIGRMDASLKGMKGFVNTATDDLSSTIHNKVINGGIKQVETQVDNAVATTIQRVKDTINATQVLNAAKELGNVVEEANKNLNTSTASVQRLKDLQGNISAELQSIKTSIDNACGAPCPLNTSKLTLNANFSGLDDLSEQTSISSAANISAHVNEATAEFDAVAGKINTTIQSYVTDAKQKVNATQTEVDKILIQINDSIQHSLVEQLNSARSYLNGTTQDDVRMIGNYIWYGCIGVGCAVLLVIFFYYMGVVFGLCGERPSHRANCCNRGTGASLLCTGICCTFLFAWLLMLLVVIIFPLGGLTYSLGCQYIQDGIEGVSTFESLVEEGFKLNISGETGIANLSLSRAFSGCKKDEPLYGAFHLEGLFNLDEALNYTGVVAEIRKMKENTITVDNITILSGDLEQQLDKLKNSSLSNVNYTDYTAQLNKSLLAFDISDVVVKLRALNDTALNASATRLETLQSTKIVEMQNEVKVLDTAVRELQDITRQDVTASVDGLITSMQKAQSDFNSGKSTIVKDELDKAVEAIVNSTETLFNESKDIVKTSSRCGSLYNYMQGLVDAFCTTTLDPLNSIWFGLGWCLFFYIPCFITAALLAGLYKRSKRYKKEDLEFDDIRSPNRGRNNGYDNGYNDNVPLTHMKDQRAPPSNGAYNHGYSGPTGGDRVGY